MKKWIWIFAIFVFVIIGLGINMYLNAVEPLRNTEAIAIETAKNETTIDLITDFSFYNGSKSYAVIKGIDHDGEAIIVWIPEDKEEKIIVKKEKSGISREEAIQKLVERKNPEEIVSVKLGVENNIPLWEIYYHSNDNLINYYYVDFETGEWLKDIQNL